ncbi:MAG: hypothetical protein VW600_14360 [Ferrovibrio sp.]
MTSGAAAAADRELGEYLSGECVTCHKPTGQSSAAIPSITGWPVEQFVAVMDAYRRKQRDNQAMQTIAGRLSDHEIVSLAAFFAALPAKP